MRVLLNFGTVKAGGGQTVALNFLSALKNLRTEKHAFVMITVQNSAIERYCTQNFLGYFPIIRFPNNPIKRIAFELFHGNRIVKHFQIDIIYSYFGYSYFPQNIPQVIGSADSNLYFPEIDFWSHYSGVAFLKRKFVDMHRMWGIKKADGILFENQAMLQRCRELFNKKEPIKYLPPSLTKTEEAHEQQKEKKDFSQEKVGLFLCGWQLNKNIMLIPEIAAALKNLNILFKIIFTAPLDDSDNYRLFVKKLKYFGVENMVMMIGTVEKNDLSSLYGKVDIVFLLSKLESFSNNIIESWYYNKLLVVSDEPWSRAICKDGALYVDRDSPKSIAREIATILENPGIGDRIKEKAQIEFSLFPTAEKRFCDELKFLEEVFHNV